MEPIIITGASGFIGSHLVDEAARRGLRVWAAVRETSSRRYLEGTGAGILELDMNDEAALRARLEAHGRQWGKPGCVVHCAGATQCRDKDEFDRVNYRQTRRLAEALRASGMTPGQFIFISTLSVYGPVHDHDFLPLSEADTPRPNTAYGLSKLKAERFLEGLEGFPYVILRPTGVYGPRERDYYLLAKSIRRHLDASVWLRRQELSFIYVLDLAQAVFRCMERGVTRRAYNLSDGRAYASRAFSDLIRRELGNPWVARVKIPLPVLKAASALSGQAAALRGRTSTFNTDKYKIMKQRNWQCDIARAKAELGFEPAYSLERGVAETIAWYKKEKWL